MRLLKPSFKLKNSDRVIFSPSGKLLAQKGSSGTKISVWDVENRELLVQHKIIPNDDTIGFLPDEQAMFVKNKNGELAFFKTMSGELISATGKNPLYGAGSNAIYQEADKLLYDGSWNGELMAWKVDPLEKVFSHTYEHHMITIIVQDDDNKEFFAVVNPTVNAEKYGGSKLLAFSKLGKQEKRDWVVPTEKALSDQYGNWKPITAMDLKSTLTLALQVDGLQEPPIIANVDVATGQTAFAELESRHQSVWSVASNESVIISAVHTSTYRQGMTCEESQKADEGVETSHLYIHDKKSLQLIDKVFWPEVFCVSFSPDGRALAIASYEKSAYIADFEKLLNK